MSSMFTYCYSVQYYMFYYRFLIWLYIWKGNFKLVFVLFFADGFTNRINITTNISLNTQLNQFKFYSVTQYKKVNNFLYQETPKDLTGHLFSSVLSARYNLKTIQRGELSLSASKLFHSFRCYNLIWHIGTRGSAETYGIY